MGLRYVLTLWSACVNAGCDMRYEEDENSEKELSIGNNTFGSNIVTVEKLQTYFSGSCYKITPNFFTLKKTLEFRMAFDNYTLIGDDIPWSIDIYVTSKDNAYGIIDSIWKNGEELILKPDTWLTVFKLNTIKYKYLAMSSNCSSDSYKSCLMEKLLGTDYEKRFGCSNTCLALSTFDHSSLEPEISRVIYDSVWNRKNYFENIAFLNFQ